MLRYYSHNLSFTDQVICLVTFVIKNQNETQESAKLPLPSQNKHHINSGLD